MNGPLQKCYFQTDLTMDHVLEDQIKMELVTLQTSVKPKGEQILEVVLLDMGFVVHVSYFSVKA